MSYIDTSPYENTSILHKHMQFILHTHQSEHKRDATGPFPHSTAQKPFNSTLYVNSLRYDSEGSHTMGHQ